MANSTPLMSLDECDKPIRVGRFVSVSASGKPILQPARRVDTDVEKRSRVRQYLDWKPRVIIAGLTLVLLCSLMVVIAATNRKPKGQPGEQGEVRAQEPAQRATQTVQVAVKRPVAAPAAPIVLPMPREWSAPQTPETIAVLPREALPEIEVIHVNPRQVVTEVTLSEEFLTSAPRVVEEPVLVVIDKPENPVQVIAPPKAECGKFATKVDFLLSPTAAYDKAKKDTNKLVMVLHIAGNFEEPGFT
jgi:hypothetical protein